MKRRTGWILGGLAFGMLFSQTAAAAQIHFTGEACPLLITPDLEGTVPYAGAVQQNDAPEEGEPETEAAAAELAVTSVTDMNVLGRTEDKVIVWMENYGAGYVSLEEFQDKVPLFDLDSLERRDQMNALRGGSDAAAVQALQAALIRLGFLEGEADGAYGSMTGDAVSRFQSSKGLPATNEADAVTQWLLQDALAADEDPKGSVTEMSYPAVISPETKFASVYESTDSDLSGFVTSDWKFAYDAFDGSGMITNAGLAAASLSLEPSPMERLAMDLSFAVEAERGESGQVHFFPVLHIESRGAYCPYVQTVTFISGSQSTEIELADTTRWVEGVEVLESDNLELSAELLSYLAGPDAGSLKLRINGQNQSYDLTLDADTAALNEYAAACETL